MNDTTDRAHPATNAHPSPDVQKWCEELVFELRLRDVRGSRIGDEVASVTTHCQQSGQSPRDAFGDPKAYAEALAFGAADVDRTTPGDFLRYGMSSILGLAGFALGQAAFSAWRAGTDTAVTWGAVLAAAILATTIVATVAFLGAILRRWWSGALFLTVACAGMVASLVLLREPAVLLPSAAALIAAAALLALSVVGEYVVGTPSDPVVDPRDGADRYPDRSGPLASIARALRPWFWPIATAVFLGVNTALGLA